MVERSLTQHPDALDCIQGNPTGQIWRPGTATARHLRHILNRITLPGSIFLATIAVLPTIAGITLDVPISFSGVSILIVVGVALETMKQIESQLTMRNYEGFLR